MKGVLDESALGLWFESLGSMPDGGATVQGSYLALRSWERVEAQVWEAWAKKQRAFADLDSGAQWGFVLLERENKASLLEAALELRQCLPQAGLALSTGSFRIQGERIFSATHWSVDSLAKEQAQKLRDKASPGELLVTEADYASLRDLVKVQLKGELLEQAGQSPLKILNVLEFS
jgi:hypothetical protein